MWITDDMLFGIHMKLEALKLQQHAGDQQHADTLPRRRQEPASRRQPAGLGARQQPSVH